MLVSDIMTTDVQSCSADTPLDAIAMLMWNHNCGAIPVVDDANLPIGMITDRDITLSSALAHKPLWDIRASDVLRDGPLYSCQAEDDIHSALKTFWAQHVRRVPVVDSDGHLQGMLSIDDIVEHAARGSRGQRPPELSYDDAITALKAVSSYH